MQNNLTERERFIQTIKRQPVGGRVPTFELVFYLTMESIGKVHPTHRNFTQWAQMSESEKKAQIADSADCYVSIAEKYHHSAIFVHPNPWDYPNTARLLEAIRERSGSQQYCLMLAGDPTFAMPNGSNMMAFTERMYEDADGLKKEAETSLRNFTEMADFYTKYPGLLDGFLLCSDYCFNTNPFFTGDMFDEFIGPYLQRIITEYHDRGYIAIKHTDGNIMPIAEELVQCGPDGLHSLDPQGGVSLTEMKKRFGHRVALCGNVNCGLLQTGTEEEAVADVRRSLREGMADGGTGYVFCTSNCAYTGLPLERYELMNRIWWEEGLLP